MEKPIRCLLVVGVGLSGLDCRPDSNTIESDPILASLLVKTATPMLPSPATLHERSGTGQLRLLGADLSIREPKRAEVTELTLFFEVLTPPTASYDVFVHGETPDGQRLFVADHAPLFGRLTTHRWKKGQIWADKHRLQIPQDAPGSSMILYVGLFKNQTRWTVQGPTGTSDGRDRIKIGPISLSGPTPKDDLPEITIPRTKALIQADGRLDEEAWSKAPVLTFSDSLGRNVKTRFPTKLRLLYDDNHLYVSFENTDRDITERYKQRDDPIYNHETVELFIMPNVMAPEVGPYIELQASPTGIIFDASFDGRRQGMNKGYDAQQTVGTTRDGTLNTLDEDRGWISEWKVPFKGLRGVDTSPQPGTEWRMNAFRIEKFREGQRQQGEYTAWSPPRVGDFHNVARFGRMKFGN